MTYALGYGLGGGGPTTPAGPINGIATLTVDVQRAAANTVEAFGPQVAFDRGDYQRFLSEAKNSPVLLRGQAIPPVRLRNFLYGVIGDVGSALARAKQLATLQVNTEVARAENHRVQAELIGAARVMLDSANTALRSVVAVGGTSGLGWVPIALAVIGATAQAAVLLGAVGAVALVYDSHQRMGHARVQADRICQQQAGGCSPQQYASIVRQLQLGPLDALAAGGASAIASAGLSAGATVAIVGASAVGLGALYFFFGTAAGRRTLRGLKKETK